MSHVSVQLLGRPSVQVDGVEAPPPKGAKPWGLLAYLASSERPHARSELAELLFGEAVDPLGALRWNLAAIRRLLDRPDALKGAQLRLDTTDLTIDTVCMHRGERNDVLGSDVGRELLAGLSFSDSPMFELWLVGERLRLRRQALSLTREVALGAFANGDHALALRAANELVTAEPLDEGHHALLIRTLVLSGDRDGARRQFEQCASLLASELQTEPGPAVLAAAHLAAHPAGPSSKPGFDEVFARMIVAWQSFLAGSIDHAIDVSRPTVRQSDVHGDLILRITSRLFLAAMLNMAVRGWDEAATATAQAIHLAEQAERDDDLALARSVLAGSALMRGDYRVAFACSESGIATSDEHGALALNHAFQSAVDSDTLRHDDALAHADHAIAHAEHTGDPVQLAYAHAYAAHANILAGRFEAARAPVLRAIDACSSVLVLKPWPMAMLAEIDVAAGDLVASAATAMEADGLATVTGIAYQRALAQRALALGEAAAGDDSAALDRLVLSLGHARRTSLQGYPFHWPVAWVLESLACISIRSRPLESRRWAGALMDHANATGMTTFAARAGRYLECTPAR